MTNLSNKIALVTGSAKNLGSAIAINLAKQGTRVAVHYHKSKKEAERTLSKVKQYSDGIMVQADLAKESQVTSMIRTIEVKLGKVDLLINLVGNFIYQDIDKTSFSKFRDVIESNLYSTFLCCQKVLPSMKKKNWGRIINFGNVAADNPQIREKTTPYFIAKTGVIMLTKVLAYQYAPYGVTVNCVSPGILETSQVKLHVLSGITSSFAGFRVERNPVPKADLENYSSTILRPWPSGTGVKLKIPPGRYAQFEDILNAINFLLKKESSYINGANIEVSGGWRTGVK